MEKVIVRRAELEDIQQIAEMCQSLWPGASIEEHARDLTLLLSAKGPGAQPSVILLAQQPTGRPDGFVEVAQLRISACS
jgi:hypothetical protein